MTVGALLALVLVASAAPSAQKVAVNPDQTYLVLEVVKLSTFEQELNDAASQGFRLLMSATSEDGQRVQALMERLAAPPATFRYRLVATMSTKTGDREMNAAGAEGFRAVPHTSMLKKGFTIFNMNSVVVMEKAPESAAGFEYLTLSANRTDTFHRELKDALGGGWKVCDMMYGQILLERARVTATAP
jgi:hypothetical protein